jgi:TonB family protein
MWFSNTITAIRTYSNQFPGRSSIIASVMLHLIGWILLLISTSVNQAPNPNDQLVKLKINVEQPTIIPPKPPPSKPRRIKKKPKRRPTSHTKPKKARPKLAKKIPPIQGLNKDSVSKEAEGIAAPVGNTMMTSDEGKRLRPEQIEGYDEDQSRDAILIRGSFAIPEYSLAALDAAIEGRYVVDVFVSKDGLVKDAELRKTIGYNMDQRILTAATSAKFEPRRNKYGGAIEGWAEIPFRLTIP